MANIKAREFQYSEAGKWIEMQTERWYINQYKETKTEWLKKNE